VFHHLSKISIPLLHADMKLILSLPVVQVRDALATKVSRERFGSELKGCFEGSFQALPPLAWHRCGPAANCIRIHARL